MRIRQCSKPGCQQSASAALGFDYSSRVAILEDAPEGDLPPQLYALCPGCADKLTPPRGWLLDDRRRIPALFIERHSSLV